MAEWQQVDMSDFFPDEVLDLAQDAKGVAISVADVFNTTADFVDTLADYIVDYADPIAALVDALIQEIRNFIGDLRRAGAFALPVVPKDRNYKGGIDGFYNAVNLSLRDEADLDRPIFSPSSQMVGYVFVYGATDLKALYEGFLAQAKLLFDFGEFKDWDWALDPDAVPSRDLRRADSVPPDWKALRVADVFPSYDRLLGELEKMVASLQRSPSTQDFVQIMANVLRGKADQLEVLADFIEFFADQVEALFNMDDVWYVKVGPMAGGMEAFLADLIAAANKPPFRGDYFYVTGVVFVAAGPDATTLEELLG